MTTGAADAGAAWENPLIPNARLRQIYRAMLQVRMLARALRGRRRGGVTLGLEACLVSASVDLGPGDLVSDALAGGVVEFLRGAKLGVVLGRDQVSTKRGVTADCGAAAPLPATADVAERIWAALGAAAALKAEAARANIESKAADETARQAGVVVVFALPGELPAPLWRKALTFAYEKELPVLFVVLPAAQAKGGNVRAAKMGGVSAMAVRCGVPGIPVDADDAVAIYRVAQESIGHARIGGGTALMECVPFVIEGAAGRRSPAADAIVGLQRYLVDRRVATQAWIEREAKSFAMRVAGENAASK
jgi:TPP-dependent pyruvate/acetoin dehydrogenase alpha subunit